MPPKKRALAIALTVWGLASATGLYTLAAHGADAGTPAEAPVTLASALRTAGHATIVVAAHPSCPCTRATFHALQALATKRGDAEILILFAGNPKRDRVAEDLRALASEIPGARIIDDPDRTIAEGLGAHTSGTVLFYDRTGALKFNGGITPSRAHEGDSAGADTIRALLAESTSVTKTSTPVFGCPIANNHP